MFLVFNEYSFQTLSSLATKYLFMADWWSHLQVVAFNVFFFAEHESSTRKSEKWLGKKLLTIKLFKNS